MKRLLLGLVCILFLCALAPLPAHAWWWHHKHHAPANTAPDAKNTKAHDEKHHRGNSDPLYTFPKTVGWWHKGPGPAGAGVK
jgi:hypothetical protein